MADMAPKSGSGPSAATAIPQTFGDRRSNSYTHQRDGQNVGYGDAHAEFARNPAIGQSNDNIWCANSGNPNSGGTPPSDSKTLPSNMGTTGGAPGAWDIVMLPITDGQSRF